MRRPGARFVATAAVLVAPVLAYWYWRAAAPPEPVDHVAATPPHMDASKQTVVASAVEPKAAKEQLAPDYSGTLLVRVVASADRGAVSGASIQVVDGSGADRRTTSAADGSAGFDGLGLGHARIRVEADGFVPSLVTVVVGPDAVEKATIPLDAAVTIEGSVVDAKSGAPIANAAVGLSTDFDPTHEHPRVAPTTTDASGRYRIGPAPAGAAVRVAASAPGHGHASVTLAAPAPGGSARRTEIRMDRTGVVQGRVLGADGQGALRGWVHVNLVDRPDQTVAGDGTFRLAEIPLGTSVEVTAGAPAWTACNSVDCVLTDEHPTATLELKLLPPTSLVVRVLGPSGDPIRASASVGPGGPWVESDLFGAITFAALDPGPCRIHVRASDCADEFTSAWLRMAQRNEIEIRLRAPVATGVLRVSVVDAAGTAVGGARIEVRDGAIAGAADDGGPTTSTANGAGTLDVHVSPGRCRVRAGGEWSEVTVPEGGEATVRVVAK